MTCVHLIDFPARPADMAGTRSLQDIFRSRHHGIRTWTGQGRKARHAMDHTTRPWRRERENTEREGAPA